MRLDILWSRTPVPYRKTLEHQGELHARRMAIHSVGEAIRHTLDYYAHPYRMTDYNV